MCPCCRPRPFVTPIDVTLQELALETLFPADSFTGEVLRKLHG